MLDRNAKLNKKLNFLNTERSQVFRRREKEQRRLLEGGEKNEMNFEGRSFS